ncbi:MAG: hypothetical protein RL693_2177, partial [Verrucomicrobiota bacterium]
RLFERHGLPQAIRSDNGAPFASRSGVLGLSRLSTRWVALGINLERSRPGCPQDNGGHERPHQALQMKCPGELYTASAQRYAGLPADLEYANMPQTRRINQHGCLRWNKHLIFISAAIASWSVGLRPRSDGLIDVYFANLLLGQLEPSTLSFIRAASGTNEADTPTEICNLKP